MFIGATRSCLERNYDLLSTLQKSKPAYLKVSDLLEQLGTNLAFTLYLLEENSKAGRIKYHKGKGCEILPEGEEYLAELRRRLNS